MFITNINFEVKLSFPFVFLSRFKCEYKRVMNEVHGSWLIQMTNYVVIGNVCSSCNFARPKTKKNPTSFRLFLFISGAHNAFLQVLNLNFGISSCLRNVT